MYTDHQEYLVIKELERETHEKLLKRIDDFLGAREEDKEVFHSYADSIIVKFFLQGNKKFDEYYTNPSKLREDLSTYGFLRLYDFENKINSECCYPDFEMIGFVSKMIAKTSMKGFIRTEYFYGAPNKIKRDEYEKTFDITSEATRKEVLYNRYLKLKNDFMELKKIDIGQKLLNDEEYSINFNGYRTYIAIKEDKKLSKQTERQFNKKLQETYKTLKTCNDDKSIHKIAKVKVKEDKFVDLYDRQYGQKYFDFLENENAVEKYDAKKYSLDKIREKYIPQMVAASCDTRLLAVRHKLTQQELEKKDRELSLKAIKLDQMERRLREEEIRKM